MAFTPVRGKFCKITDNAGTPNVYPAVNWELEVDGNNTDVSNFRDGRRNTDTLEKATIKAELIYDEDSPPDKAATINLRPGADVTAKLYVNEAQSKFWSIPCKVSKITPKVSGQEDVLKYDVELMQNGTITYPVHA
jgi:hypothetical protein